MEIVDLQDVRLLSIAMVDMDDMEVEPFREKIVQKVDRSAAYAARYVAKNIVAAGLADRCEVQVSYAIELQDQFLLM